MHPNNGKEFAKYLAHLRFEGADPLLSIFISAESFPSQPSGTEREAVGTEAVALVAHLLCVQRSLV